MANQLTRYATVATVDTAGEGGFWGFIVYPDEAGNNTLISDGVERTFVYQFVLPFRATISVVVSEVRVTEAGKKYGLGIYDVNGDLVVRTAALSLDSSGIQESSLVAAATLEPGIYYHAQTTDATGTGALRGVGFSTPAVGIMNQGSEARVGRAGNNGSAGVLAATMGGITASTSRIAGMAFFKP